MKYFPLFSGLVARNKTASATEYAWLMRMALARNTSAASIGNMLDSVRNKLAHP